MGWLEVYSQTEASDMFSNCKLASCNIGSGENFINFDAMPDMREYHFKLVWDGGKNSKAEDVEIEWKQTQNPLSATNLDMNPTEAVRHPSNTTPLYFAGLSLSTSSKTLLDGNTGGNWFYSVGNAKWNWNEGNPKYPGASGAKKTQLFVRVVCDHDGGICKGNNCGKSGVNLLTTYRLFQIKLFLNGKLTLELLGVPVPLDLLCTMPTATSFTRENHLLPITINLVVLRLGT